MTNITHRMYWRVLFAAVVLSLFGFFAVIWYAGTLARHERQRAQDELHQLCGIVYMNTARFLATVGRKGSSGYAYYRVHPDELVLVKAEARRALRRLPCGPPEKGS